MNNRTIQTNVLVVLIVSSLTLLSVPEVRGGNKEKISLQEFTDSMLYMATCLQRRENFTEMIRKTLKNNPEHTDKIHIELAAFQYWLQCFIMQVALKSKECHWEKAVEEFEKAWMRFHLKGDVFQVGNDLIKSSIPKIKISSKEFFQILRDRTNAYDKAFYEKRGRREGKSWPLEQVATDLCQNLGMGRDSQRIAELFIHIGFTLKYQRQALEKFAEQFDLSFLY